jgi:23S rRNA pseudouridine2605 synthase
MPRDNDKDNDARGRRDRPPGGRSGGGKGRSGAARGPEKKFAKRDGDKTSFNRDDRPARAGDGEKRAFKPRGDRPKFGDGDKRPYTPRGNRDDARPAARSSERKFGERKPYTPREGGGDKRPYTPRADRGEGSSERKFGERKPYTPREGGGDKRPYTPRADRGEGSSDRKFGERKPYTPREGGGDKRPYTPRASRDAGSSDRKFGDRKPYTPREGGGDKRPYTPRADRGAGSSDRKFGERKPYTPREGGGDKRPYTPREGGGEKRPYTPRTNRDDARPAARSSERKFGDRKPYTPREGGGEKRPYTPREGGGDKRHYTPRGERSFGDRPQRSGDRPDRKFGGDKTFSRGADGDRKSSWTDRKGSPGNRGPRRDFGDRPSGGDSKPWQKREGGSDRPERSSRPPRDFDRPKFDRPREDRPKFDRPRERSEDRPRDQFSERPRRDNEDESRVFAKRPAFGGRGAYRDRKPETDKRAVRDQPPRSTKSGERIAKVVSRAGLASRRDAEEWIVQGRVTVNGRIINSPALDVTTNDVIQVDGKPLPERERTRLFLYHKPRGLMTTHADPEGRPTVFDNLPEHLPRVISIGRLDFNTEGLLLLTNDGGLARALELPETGWLRRYRVRAHGEVTQAQLDQLAAGIEVDGVKYGPIEASLDRDQGANVWLVVAIREGKNREVRNVLAHLGLEVNRLIRVSYGPFQLGEILEGEVQEIKTRVLREQLGEKVIALAGADFGPVEGKGNREPLPDPKAKPQRGIVADSKGRRVRVERTGSDEARARNEDEAHGYGPPKRPKRGYHGKRDLKPPGE